VLNQLPQFAPAGTQFTTGDIFPTAINTPGAATLNLRALGTNRTLVLLDGRRGQPINSTLVIDTNSIPSAAIESVEVISGGASAVYGADAMAGVVNFRLKRNFEGASLNFRSGITEAGDGEENSVSALLGANLGEGRGNAMLGLEWTKREAALAAERPFFSDSWYDPGAPGTLIRLNATSYEPNSAAGGLPSQTAVNNLYPNRSGDVLRTSPFFLNSNGTLFKQAGALGYNGPLNDGRYKMQPNGTLGENNLDAWVSSPLTRYSIFGKTDYEINEKVGVFTQLHFVSTEVDSLSQPSGATGGFSVNIPRDAEHPVPDQLAALLDSRGPNVLSTTEFDPATGQPLIVTGVDAPWALGKTLDFLPARGINNTTRLFQLLAGLRGETGIGDWSWEAYISHGDTENDSNYVGYASMARYEAVVSAPFYGRGFTADGIGQTTLTCTSGLPIFESFPVTQDCIDAITVNATDTSSLSQDIVEANFEGGLFELPAGEMRSAVGLSYRKNHFEFLPDATRESNNIVDIPISVFGSANVRGETDVKEV
jgi:iron complex outermembrane receptor protein